MVLPVVMSWDVPVMLRLLLEKKRAAGVVQLWRKARLHHRFLSLLLLVLVLLLALLLLLLLLLVLVLLVVVVVVVLLLLLLLLLRVVDSNAW